MTITSRLKPPGKNYSVAAKNAHILLGYDYYQLFKTPRIKNYSVIAPSAKMVLGDDDAQ